MRTFSEYIKEAIDFRLGGKAKKGLQYNYTPKDKDELYELMRKLRKERGDDGDFNDIDTQYITNMSYLFYDDRPSTNKFNGDISLWNTSNVTKMKSMFQHSRFFNQDISMWDTSEVTDMSTMFYKAKVFNTDISQWNVSNVTRYVAMFIGCPIKEEYKPKFR